MGENPYGNSELSSTRTHDQQLHHPEHLPNEQLLSRGKGSRSWMKASKAAHGWFLFLFFYASTLQVQAVVSELTHKLTPPHSRPHAHTLCVS